MRFQLVHFLLLFQNLFEKCNSLAQCKHYGNFGRARAHIKKHACLPPAIAQSSSVLDYRNGPHKHTLTYMSSSYISTFSIMDTGYIFQTGLSWPWFFLGTPWLAIILGNVIKKYLQKLNLIHHACMHA